MSNPKIDKKGNKVWYNEKGQFHRDDGPAVEYANGDTHWFINGKRHRLDGPAYERNKHSYKEYWINGKYYDSLEEGLMEQALE